MILINETIRYTIESKKIQRFLVLSVRIGPNNSLLDPPLSQFPVYLRELGFSEMLRVLLLLLAVAVIPHKDHKRFLVTGIGDDEGFVP